MVTRSISIIALVLLSAGAAQAQGYLRVGAGMIDPMGTNVDVSGSIVEDTGLLTTHSGGGSINHDFGFAASIAYGYRISDRLALEFAGDYARFSNSKFASSVIADEADDNEDGSFAVKSTTTVITGMVNAIYSPHRFGAFTPYVGIGAGIGYVHMPAPAVIAVAEDTDGLEAAFKVSKIAPAANAILGVEYALSEHWSADARYRFLWFGSHQTNTAGLTARVGDLMAHELTLGAVYRF